MNPNAVDINVNTVAITGFLIFALLGGFIVFFIILYRQTQRNHQREKERIRVEMERQQLEAQLEITEETMRRISMEIHDNVGQVLSLAKLQLAQTSPDKIEESIHAGRDLITRALADLRNLSRSLNGQYITEISLSDAIQRELKLVSGTGTLECQFFSDDDIPALTDRQQIMLFRCIQESISNAIKHAKGNGIIIHLKYANSVLTASIEDNGQGMDLANVTHGIGMQSLSERMHLISGEMHLESAPNKGTKITLTLPVLAETTQYV
jgi:signal transduction histidine kinase